MSTENPKSESPKDKSELVKLARQLLDELPAPKNISDTTINEYEREFKRLWSKSNSVAPDRLFAAICETSSKRTYYRRLAALKYGLRSHIQKALDEDKLNALRYLLSLHALLNQNTGACPITSPKPRRSKRRALKGLPLNWRELMYASLTTSKYRIQYVVMALTGCRPAELQAGVIVSKSNDTFTLTIGGAKVKDSQGQPIREISYSIEDPHPLIQALLTDKQFRLGIINVSNKQNFTSAIRRVGNKLWPRRNFEITPYCLRHAAASDFKEFLSPENVSKAMGHAVDATKSLYGQRQMSRSGGLKPFAVQAAREIKLTTKSSYRAKSRREPN